MAWTGNFKTQIIDIAGAFSDTSAMQQWLIDGCHEVIRRLKDKEGDDAILDFTTSSTSTSNAIDISGIRDIFAMYRNNIPVNMGSYLLKHKYTDAHSMYFPTDNSPIFYIEGRTLYVYPEPSVTETVEYRYVPEFTLTNWDSGVSSITYYPVQWYRYVMLYGAIQVLHKKMVNLITEDPQINVVIPEAPLLPTLGVGEAGAVIINNLGTPPTFDGSTLTSTISAVDTALDDEDSEIAQARISEANLRLQAELQEFNEKNVAYQAAIQQAQLNAQANKEDYAQTLSKFNTEISLYSAEVQAAVQEYGNKSQDMQWLSATYSRVRADYEQGLGLAPQDQGKAS